jgi:Succinyl-CoA synthetase, beta subunit
MILTTIQRRSLYIKQHQAFDILKGESVAVRDAGASDGDFSLSISVDRSALSPCITVSPTVDTETSLSLSRKFPFSYTNPDFSKDGFLISSVTSHLKLPKEARGGLQKLVEKLWRIFKEKEAFILETRTILTPEGNLEVHGARFGFDDAAYRSSGRQEEIHKLRNKAEEVPEEVEAEKDGIVYVKYALQQSDILLNLC